MQYRINLKQLEDFAQTGVRRAVLFLGLGLNAAHKKDFQDYQLWKLPILPGQTGLPIDFLPRTVPTSTLEAYKREFATWITGCGLREVLECYAIFLDQIHGHALTVHQAQSDYSEFGEPEKLHREFERLGVPDKLKTVKKRFGIEPTDPDAIRTLYVARNCLTHDLGVVHSKRSNEGDAFVVRWRALDFIARGLETGTEQPLAELIGNVTTEETGIAVKWTERRKPFKPGDKLSLSQQDLWEICYFFRAVAIPSAGNSFVAFLKRHRVPVNDST